MESEQQVLDRMCCLSIPFRAQTTELNLDLKLLSVTHFMAPLMCVVTITAHNTNHHFLFYYSQQMSVLLSLYFYVLNASCFSGGNGLPYFKIPKAL